jgi:ketosteroid isomerase-like protein
MLLLVVSQTSFADQNERLAELDAYWAGAARTVREGDFEGYSATYHQDAILVSGAKKESYPISKALAGWKQGFVDTKTKKMKANVEFRFTQRLGDDTTAHETGMFHYWTVDADGKTTDAYVHFEGLLIKKKTGWKLMMEYQTSPATLSQWNAAK